MKFLSHIPSWLKSKYLMASLAFIVWMLFFDKDDITLQWKRIKELKQLQQSESKMSDQIARTKKELDLLRTSPATLEKYAREKYMMKKENEDLYIIEKADKNTSQ